MGRKKASKPAGAAPSAEPTPAATQSNAKVEAPTLAGAIAHALKTLGAEAETVEVKNWIVQNYPGVDVNAPSWQSTLSVKRKAARGGVSSRKKPGRKPGKKPGQKATSPAAAAPAPKTAIGPSFAELL